MSLLMKTRPLVIIPELAVSVGINEAIVLQQIHYWISETNSGIEKNGRRWVYNTMADWLTQFPFFSESTLKRAFNSLKEKGCLHIEKLSSDPRDRTNFYSINYDCDLINTKNKSEKKEEMIEQMHEFKMSSLIRSKCTDVHTETTTEIINTPLPPEGEIPALPECGHARKAQRKKPDKIPYAEIMESYNEILGDRLPEAITLNDKRKRAMKRIWGELTSPSVDSVKTYFHRFSELATKFYFGENDNGWTANFDYLMRSETLIKTRERAL
jgi:hypothetical protein